MLDKEVKLAMRAFIQDEKGRVLLGKRVRGRGVGQFALIGGKPEKGESNEEAIAREVFEEVGLEFQPKGFTKIVDLQSDPNSVWEVYYFSGVSQGQPKFKKDEITEIIYVREEDLDTIDIAFDHKERLIDFFRGAH